MTEKYRPLIGISVGDPSGIGPEITAKALALPDIYEICRPLAVAEAEMMEEAVRFSGKYDPGDPNCCTISITTLKGGYNERFYFSNAA